MRVRLAIGVASAIVVVKAGLTLVVLNAWASYPERPGPHRWHIELGSVADWLAAVFTGLAAGAALWIATRDRQHRIEERHDEQKTMARLVQLSVASNDRAAVVVEVRNYGPLPVIDVEPIDATWSEHPEARWEPQKTAWQQARGEPGYRLHRPILKPSQSFEDSHDTLADFVFLFMHPTEDEPLAPLDAHGARYQVASYLPTDVSNVVAKVQFTTADGVRWETPSKGAGTGEPLRISR
jgi:hypothetical protein